jgi:hypothetical protein
MKRIYYLGVGKHTIYQHTVSRSHMVIYMEAIGAFLLGVEMNTIEFG